jgi:hypothetical protein
MGVCRLAARSGQLGFIISLILETFSLILDVISLLLNIISLLLNIISLILDIITLKPDRFRLIQTSIQRIRPGICPLHRCSRPLAQPLRAVMRVANSAVFRPPRAAQNLAQAVAMIGLSKRLGIAASVSLRNGKMPRPIPEVVEAHHNPAAAHAQSPECLALCCLLAAGRRIRDGEPDHWLAEWHEIGNTYWASTTPCWPASARLARNALCDGELPASCRGAAGTCASPPATHQA